MGCKRRTSTSSLLGVLLISLLALLGLLPNIASARHVAVLKSNNDMSSKGDMVMKLAIDDATHAHGGSKGRRLGAEKAAERVAAMEVVKESSKKGKSTSYPFKKPRASSGQELHPQKASAATAIDSSAHEHLQPRSTTRTAAMILGARHQTQKPQRPPGKAQPGDAAAAAMAMFNMLNKDYTSRARRRSPINNDMPLQEEEP